MIQVATPTTMAVMTDPITETTSYTESSSHCPRCRFNPIGFISDPPLLRITRKVLTTKLASLNMLKHVIGMFGNF